jgi:hypothetical protein
MGWFEAVNGNYPRVAVAVERFTEVGLGGSDVWRVRLR